MDAKSDKYNVVNIPDMLWDAIPPDSKKSVDEDTNQKLKGNIILKEKIARVDKQNDIA